MVFLIYDKQPRIHLSACGSVITNMTVGGLKDGNVSKGIELRSR